MLRLPLFFKLFQIIQPRFSAAGRRKSAARTRETRSPPLFFLFFSVYVPFLSFFCVLSFCFSFACGGFFLFFLFFFFLFFPSSFFSSFFSFFFFFFLFFLFFFFFLLPLFSSPCCLVRVSSRPSHLCFFCLSHLFFSFLSLFFPPFFLILFFFRIRLAPFARLLSPAFSLLSFFLPFFFYPFFFLSLSLFRLPLGIHSHLPSFFHLFFLFSSWLPCLSPFPPPPPSLLPFLLPFPPLLLSSSSPSPTGYWPARLSKLRERSGVLVGRRQDEHALVR